MPFMVYIYLIIGLLILIDHYRTYWQHYVASRKIPGPMVFPIIGNIPQLMTKSKAGLVRSIIGLGKRSDPLFRLWLGSKFVVLVSDPSDIKTVMAKCINRSSVYNEILAIFGDGLFNLRDDAWKERRRLLNPALNYKQIASFQDIFNRGADDLVALLDEGKLNYLQIMNQATLKNVFQTTMGLDDAKVGLEPTVDSKEYLTVYPELLKMGGLIMENPMLKLNPFYEKTKFCKKYVQLSETAKKFIEKMVRRGIEKAITVAPEDTDTYHEEDEAKSPNIFIHQMLKGNSRGGCMTDVDILNESRTIVLAGSDTTASSLGLVLFLLAQHPECQQKAYEEVVRVAPYGNLTMKESPQLEYLECVIKEALRLFPLIPLMTREVKEPITLSGREIPRGTHVMVSSLSMQRSTKWWGDNAHLFQPDRFLPENLPENSSNLFIPFGAGNRNCIGMRYAMYVLKVSVAKIIRNFEMKTPTKFEEISLTLSTVLNISNTDKVTFIRRERDLIL